MVFDGAAILPQDRKRNLRFIRGASWRIYLRGHRLCERAGIFRRRSPLHADRQLAAVAPAARGRPMQIADMWPAPWIPGAITGEVSIRTIRNRHDEDFEDT